jgi:hypothetical protein
LIYSNIVRPSVGPTASVSAGLGLGANVLIGGGNQQISLQPVSVEGNVGLNVAAGLAEVSLKVAKQRLCSSDSA